jgi:hypothetical protein
MLLRSVSAWIVAVLLLGCCLVVVRNQAVSGRRPDTTACRYSVSAVGNSAVFLDGIRGDSWILQYRENDVPMWFPLPTPSTDVDPLSWEGTQRSILSSVPTQTPTVPAREALERQGYTRVRIERSISGYLMIKAKINDKALNLVLDTGTTSTRLDEVRTRSLGLQWQDDPSDAQKAESTKLTAHAVVRSIELGPFRSEALRVGQYDFSITNQVLAKHYSDPPLDGALGGDLLERHSAILDYRTLDLYLMKRD